MKGRKSVSRNRATFVFGSDGGSLNISLGSDGSFSSVRTDSISVQVGAPERKASAGSSYGRVQDALREDAIRAQMIRLFGEDEVNRRETEGERTSRLLREEARRCFGGGESAPIQRDILCERPRAAAPEKKLTPEEIFLKTCNPITKDYIESFVGKKSHRDIIKDLQLTEAELKLFNEKCTDVSGIMNRPVWLYGYAESYDLNTVLGFNGVHPKTKEKFTAGHIMPRTTIVKEFQKIVTKIETDRNLAAAAKLDPTPPGGLALR